MPLLQGTQWDGANPSAADTTRTFFRSSHRGFVLGAICTAGGGYLFSPA